MFQDAYNGKKVVVTGHTGFKGSWLTAWLLKLGANVVGISNGIPTSPSMFEDLNLEREIEHNIVDVRDVESIYSIIDEAQPDFVFHLAAQAIVSTSYEYPLETLSTNILGTATIIDVLRRLNRKCNLILITSDKCYENVEWLWGYKETDQLGGKDIYSASKGAAELVVHAYYKSFVSDETCLLRIASARAGNVIGGGDWAKDRIVVDCVKSWNERQPVTIRNPNATRPWQHVLEPLSGYLWLGVALFREENTISGEAFNFGPSVERSHSVKDLISDLARAWGYSEIGSALVIEPNHSFNEAGLLKLNCEKAGHMLDWQSTLNYHECVEMVAEWYLTYFGKGDDLKIKTLEQISRFETMASNRRQAWAKEI